MAKSIDNITEGIPANLTLAVAREYAKKRVTEKRFQHIAGVAKVARELAEQTGTDSRAAELASWLHDACKELKGKELVEQAKLFGMKLTPEEEENGHLFHGPVAAFTVKKELGLTNQTILDAISEHTLGGVKMTTLSKIVFLADCLESSRSTEYTAPIWKALKGNPTQSEGALNLDAAMLEACDLNLKHLTESGRLVHPRTSEVRNYFFKKVQSQNK